MNVCRYDQARISALFFVLWDKIDKVKSQSLRQHPGQKTRPMPGKFQRLVLLRCASGIMALELLSEAFSCFQASAVGFACTNENDSLSWDTFEIGS